MERVVCPYCDEFVTIDTSDHYEGYEQYECEKCEKVFEVYAEPTVNYSACDKSDCLNGGEHKWKQINGFPEIHFRGKYCCETCSAEKTVEEELATKQEYDEYFNEL